MILRGLNYGIVIGLTQEVPGRVIGGGPCAFRKYESGDLAPSRAISSVLILLDRQPEALAVLKARRGGDGAPLSKRTGRDRERSAAA